MALTRKTVRNILQKDGELDDKLEQIMALYGASFNDYVSKSDIEQIKKDAIDEAMKGKPNDYKESQEWKDMESKIAEYERKEQIRNLTDRGVKNEKYAEMLIGKLDSEKDIDEQLSSFKEEYADMFNVEKETKPQFGSGTKGSMPQGNEKQSFGEIWGFVPKK